MKFILCIFLLFDSLGPAFAQPGYAAIADSAFMLISDPYLPHEQLRGKVKSYEIQLRFAAEVDYVSQLLLFNEWKFPGMESHIEQDLKPDKDRYVPVVKMDFNKDGKPALLQLFQNGHAANSFNYAAVAPDGYSSYSFQFSGDTVIAQSIDDPLPWRIVRFLRNGLILQIRSKAESDVIFYEDYNFSYPKPGITQIHHYTQAVVYDANYEATYIPDTPGVTRRNKYEPAVPDVHALRHTALVDHIELMSTDTGYTRRYYPDNGADTHQTYAVVNKKGLITETIFTLYATAIMRNQYTYDAHGNWISRIITFPGVHELMNLSPVVRKIIYAE